MAQSRSRKCSGSSERLVDWIDPNSISGWHCPADVDGLIQRMALAASDRPAMSLPSTHGARPPLGAVSLSSSSGMLNKFAAPLLRAQPVRSPVPPLSARAACPAFSPDVDADVCRWGDGLHS